MNCYRKRVIALILAVLFSLVLTGCDFSDLEKAVDINDKNIGTESKDELEIHFLDIGQGDSTLIRCGGNSMLIDAGGNGKGTWIRNYLKKHDVETLDYLILTHPDADHIDGAASIISNMDIAHVIMTDVENDTRTYENMMNEISYKNITPMVPVAGDIFSLGSATVKILGPAKRYDNTNDSSIVTLITHGENRFLFTGDCEEAAENDLVDLYGTDIKDINVYKAGHHGSKTATSDVLISCINPEYCVISCGEENVYGHPHAEVLNKLRTAGVMVFRTDEQGSIVAVSDGKEIKWNCSPSQTWKAGENVSHSVTEPPAATVPPSKFTYILNTNTRKIHMPGCVSVADMKEKNKAYTNQSIDELEAEGYTKCRRCMGD